MKTFIFATALALPLVAGSIASAAGNGNGSSVPKKPKCETGLVYDKKTKTCVIAKESNLSVDTLYDTVQELAYAGRYSDAQTVLAAMPQDDDRTLTYMGFTNRKMGNIDTAMAFYTRAIETNPSNVLARSYMGQGLVEMGQITAAIAELHAIRAHGGSGTWAEASLAKAIATGETFNY